MNVYCVMISFLLIFGVFGSVQQAFARSLLLPASFGNDAKAYFDNQEKLLDVRLQEDSSLDLLNNIEQLFVMVKTKTTRGKRYIQQRKYNLTPCFFKICNMGRKRVAHHNL
ncbi:unnamed protein product [Ceutorhynchus assimilis]|uniref:Uncharacterized protein n=1 Tax=Ceutorhynchus assimilis TaxID=467358 RepID=A0A9N9MGT9_9CUCU|nr:unnamed protein product [Ceutorhynchus assimilis]